MTKQSLIIEDSKPVNNNLKTALERRGFIAKTSSNDTGIGLYMSKSIIEEHMNGKLEVLNTFSDAPFKITLPVAN